MSSSSGNLPKEGYFYDESFLELEAAYRQKREETLRQLQSEVGYSGSTDSSKKARAPRKPKEPKAHEPGTPAEKKSRSKKDKSAEEALALAEAQYGVVQTIDENGNPMPSPAPKPRKPAVKKVAAAAAVATETAASGKAKGKRSKAATYYVPLDFPHTHTPPPCTLTALNDNATLRQWLDWVLPLWDAQRERGMRHRPDSEPLLALTRPAAARQPRRADAAGVPRARVVEKRVSAEGRELSEDLTLEGWWSPLLQGDAQVLAQVPAYWQSTVVRAWDVCTRLGQSWRSDAELEVDLSALSLHTFVRALTGPKNHLLDVLMASLLRLATRPTRLAMLRRRQGRGAAEAADAAVEEEAAPAAAVAQEEEADGPSRRSTRASEAKTPKKEEEPRRVEEEESFEAEYEEALVSGQPVCPLTWQFALRQRILEARKYVVLPLPVRAYTQHDYERCDGLQTLTRAGPVSDLMFDVTALLRVNDFALLPLERRLAVLALLVRWALSSKFSKACLEAHLEAHEQQRRHLARLQGEAAGNAKYREKVKKDIGAAMAQLLLEAEVLAGDDVSALAAASKGKGAATLADPLTGVEDAAALSSRYEHMYAAGAQAAEAHAIALAQLQVRAVSITHPLRGVFLGLDRFYTQYWALGAGVGHLFAFRSKGMKSFDTHAVAHPPQDVIGSLARLAALLTGDTASAPGEVVEVVDVPRDALPARGQWSMFGDAAALTALLASLNEAGEREYALKQALLDYLTHASLVHELATAGPAALAGRTAEQLVPAANALEAGMALMSAPRAPEPVPTPAPAALAQPFSEEDPALVQALFSNPACLPADATLVRPYDDPAQLLQWSTAQLAAAQRADLTLLYRSVRHYSRCAAAIAEEEGDARCPVCCEVISAGNAGRLHCPCCHRGFGSSGRAAFVKHVQECMDNRALAMGDVPVCDEGEGAVTAPVVAVSAADAPAEAAADPASATDAAPMKDEDADTATTDIQKLKQEAALADATAEDAAVSNPGAPGEIKAEMTDQDASVGAGEGEGGVKEESLAPTAASEEIAATAAAATAAAEEREKDERERKEKEKDEDDGEGDDGQSWRQTEREREAQEQEKHQWQVQRSEVFSSQCNTAVRCVPELRVARCLLLDMYTCLPTAAIYAQKAAVSEWVDSVKRACTFLSVIRSTLGLLNLIKPQYIRPGFERAAWERHLAECLSLQELLWRVLELDRYIVVGDSRVGGVGDDDEVRCVKCGKDTSQGALTVCSGCDAGFHLHCAGLVSPPRGEWQCASCRRVRSAEERKEREKEKERRARDAERRAARQQAAAEAAEARKKSRAAIVATPSRSSTAAANSRATRSKAEPASKSRATRATPRSTPTRSRRAAVEEEEEEDEEEEVSPRGRSRRAAQPQPRGRTAAANTREEEEVEEEEEEEEEEDEDEEEDEAEEESSTDSDSASEEEEQPRRSSRHATPPQSRRGTSPTPSRSRSRAQPTRGDTRNRQGSGKLAPTRSSRHDGRGRRGVPADLSDFIAEDEDEEADAAAAYRRVFAQGSGDDSSTEDGSGSGTDEEDATEDKRSTRSRGRSAPAPSAKGRSRGSPAPSSGRGATASRSGKRGRAAEQEEEEEEEEVAVKKKKRVIDDDSE